MLSRHVKAGGARVLQLGGSTRDLFYYPQGTVQVTVAARDLSVSLWEQAGMQATVPVRAVKSESLMKTLSASPGSNYDSVVAFDQLEQGSNGDIKAVIEQIWRVLKPGGTFIFIQRVSNSGVSGIVRLGSSQPAIGTL